MGFWGMTYLSKVCNLGFGFSPLFSMILRCVFVSVCRCVMRIQRCLSCLVERLWEMQFNSGKPNRLKESFDLLEKSSQLRSS